MLLNINYDLFVMHVVVTRSLCKVSEQLVKWSTRKVQTAADWWDKGKTAEILGPYGDDGHAGIILLPSPSSSSFLSSIWFILGLSSDLDF